MKNILFYGDDDKSRLSVTLEKRLSVADGANFGSSGAR